MGEYFKTGIIPYQASNTQNLPRSDYTPYKTADSPAPEVRIGICSQTRDEFRSPESNKVIYQYILKRGTLKAVCSLAYRSIQHS
ncbi:hypothetical protein ACN42_g11630 [Penicillium freii]|uniref:Uncharacterized protein n=1 Tax=Penicillium freii TaxID=48697 RepID=A0A101M871_PENFR|nr:hypothetical protein ACN42_g11630 [Penicillium freii]